MARSSSPDTLIQLREVLVRHGFQPDNVLDDRLLRFMNQIPQQSFTNIVEEFDMALQTNRDSIRNPTAYLMGVSKRILDSLGEQVRKSAANEPVMGRDLTRAVHDRLRQLEVEGFCSLDEITLECYELLAAMSEREAITAIDELQTADRKYARVPSGLGKRASDHMEVIPESRMFMYPHLKPPPSMPISLYYFEPFKEYAPCMPTPLDDKRLNPWILDKIRHLVEQNIFSYSDFDARLVAELNKCSSQNAVQALTEFATSDRSNIKNLGGYMFGIVKRLSKGGDDRGPGVPFYAAPGGPDYMHGGSVVDHVIMQKIQQRILRDTDLDRQTREHLNSLPEAVSVRAVEELCRKDLSTVKNKSAFIKGILKRILERGDE